QGEHGAVFWRKTGENGFETGAAFVGLDRFGGERCGIDRFKRSRGFSVVVLALKGQKPIEPAPPFAQVIERAAGGDGMQPGGELGVAAKRGQLLPDLEPDFLAD